MDGHGRSYVSEAVALGVLAGFSWLFFSIASTTSQPVLRAFLYWAAAGGTSSLLVASSTALAAPQGASLQLDTVHIRPPPPAPSSICTSALGLQLPLICSDVALASCRSAVMAMRDDYPQRNVR